MKYIAIVLTSFVISASANAIETQPNSTTSVSNLDSKKVVVARTPSRKCTPSPREKCDNRW